MRQSIVRFPLRVLAGGAIAVILYSMASFQQASGQFLLRNSLLAGGLGVASEASNSLSSTLSQPFVGSMAGGGTPGYGQMLGFWYAQQSALTGLHTASGLPTDFRLNQNFPNPFNPTTVITYQLPAASKVRIVVYDLLGREVMKLAEERKEPGWYTHRFDGSGLPSGVYFYRLQAGADHATIKMALVR